MSGKKKITKKQWDLLAKAAIKARQKSYAPYSRFKVGAALLVANNEIICGCNVENASYGLAVCAERNAIFSAVAQGKKDFYAIAIASSSKDPAPPCGMCLQVMVEFCTDLDILLVNSFGTRKYTKLSKSLPSPFRWKGVK